MSESLYTRHARFLSAREHFHYLETRIAQSAANGFLPSAEEIAEFRDAQAKKEAALISWLDADDAAHESRMQLARERAL